MLFHVELEYRSEAREELIRFLAAGALQTEEPLKMVGSWVAAESGTGYAIIETPDARTLYSFCATWSEYGCVKVTPLLSTKELKHG